MFYKIILMVLDNFRNLLNVILIVHLYRYFIRIIQPFKN